MAPVQIALWTALGVALVISVVTDVVSRRILDLVTYPAMAVLLGIRAVATGLGDWESGLLSGVAAAAGLMGFFSLLAWRGRMGWGDVKLMGVVGAGFGFPLGLSALIFISLVGALQALVTLLWKGQFWDSLAGAARKLAQRLRLVPGDAAPLPGRHIPYAVAIASGSAWAMWWEQLARH
jgi:prepilin peptidase CpaA